MVGVSASINLPLHHKVKKFSSGTGSPERSRKKGRKMVVVVVQCMTVICHQVTYNKHNSANLTRYFASY